ncbi:MAG TPA: hypothetical protein PK961_11985 [bacterium]|nr:hypothetical protein [bacterium]
MRKHIFAVTILLALLAVWAGVSAAKDNSVMVDSIVATLENEIITLEDIRVERIMLERTKVWFSQAEPPARLTDQEVFQEILAAKLLYLQARKMGFGEVSGKKVAGEMKTFRESFGSEKAYKRWLLQYELRDDGVPIPENVSYKYFRPIARTMQRRLAIEQYLEKKIGIQVKLSLNSYFAEHEEELAQKYPDADEAELEKIAERDIYNQKLQDHIAEIRARAQLVILRDNFQ